MTIISHAAWKIASSPCSCQNSMSNLRSGNPSRTTRVFHGRFSPASMDIPISAQLALLIGSRKHLLYTIFACAVEPDFPRSIRFLLVRNRHELSCLLGRPFPNSEENSPNPKSAQIEKSGSAATEREILGRAHGLEKSGSDNSRKSPGRGWR